MMNFTKMQKSEKDEILFSTNCENILQKVSRESLVNVGRGKVSVGKNNKKSSTSNKIKNPS